MFRLILFVVVLVLMVVAGIAVALHHFFGWKGLIAFPFILIALVWLARIVLGRMFKRFALGLFGMKAGVLRGATLIVHSVTAVSAPERAATDPEHEPDNEPGSEAGEPSEPVADSAAGPRHYFLVDATITPKVAGEHVWEPGEFILTSARLKSLADLEDGAHELGTTEQVEIWDGTTFGPDDPGKYPGPQRVRLTFAVKPGTTRAWMHYYAEPIGEVELPSWTADRPA